MEQSAHDRLGRDHEGDGGGEGEAGTGSLFGAVEDGADEVGVGLRHPTPGTTLNFGGQAVAVTLATGRSLERFLVSLDGAAGSPHYNLTGIEQMLLECVADVGVLGVVRSEGSGEGTHQASTRRRSSSEGVGE